MSRRVEAVVPISIGEYCDRLTILELKAERAGSATARASAHETLLAWTEAHPAPTAPAVCELIDRLRRVNGTLWHAEDEIRSWIDEGATDRIAALAADIVRLNGLRAEIKAAIDRRSGSAWTDAKHYLGGDAHGSAPTAAPG